MTRIIAGALGGRRIRTPRGSATRPTTDRVREALFARLQAWTDLDGAHVLDLYAGSGALGLEAASRGAATVLLVESDRSTAALLQDNIAALGVGDRCRVRRDRAERVVAGGPLGTAYDLVLLDPPYPLGEEGLAEVLRGLVGQGWLAERALVVVERSSRSAGPTWPPGLVPLDTKTYGQTTLHYAEESAPPPDGAREATSPSTAPSP
ncbi:16S rRNA (guanine(966)-N(2))-methyltransferase RsmD [Ornithinicoccus hortensis]|uniref:16S rRNA (Guanine966-N2)-methyltransferase n=1 Tax=Ornithinicoccus hortensis TaxID=82346 RepID=A0A542YRK0_9MICO|nr:16S rRNA (guanine(966)-N(2))-methyltransferase RsmD [Ornithinicoccus hortensis]TQL50725.1 16S rRNA (guanine966-N2)-methyltransferase [Ornithinicoccus hortensis]